MRKLLKLQTLLSNVSLIRDTNKFLCQKVYMLLGLVLLNIFSTEATTYYSKSTGAPEVYTSWATNSDGTGSAPTNFTTDGDIFIIQSGTTMTTNATWIIGNGAVGNIVTLQIVGNLILGNGDVLTIRSNSVIVFNSTNTITLGNGSKKIFNLNANATFKTINTKGISGTSCSLPAVSNKFEINSDPAANYEFNGTADQATLGLPATVKSLTISNTSGIVTLQTPLTATTLTIKPGAKLTHTTGALTATNFDIQSNATDRGTFVVNGTGTVNATTTTVQQYLANARNWYISSPVTNATTAALSTAASVVSYNEPTATWTPESGTTLVPMKGYIAVSPTANGVVTFSGAMNTGNKSISLVRTSGVSKSGFNLVGNPYPSYLDWSLASAANTGVMTTIWYRTKTSLNAYTFDTYNASGNTHTSNGANTVSKLIPPVQAFWVRVNEGVPSTTLLFTNAMCSHSDVNTNKLKAPSAVQSAQKILRLKVTNGTNSDEAIILFNPNAQDGLDDFDSPKMTNANPVIPEIYTLAGNEHVVINGFSTVYYDTEIPLGFTTGEANAFSIKATEMNNFDEGTIVVLKDNQKLTDQEQILSLDKPYDFTSDVFASTGRFSLIFRTTSITTGTNEEIANQRILINKNDNKQITINCLSGLVDKSYVSVYNAQGKLLVTKQLTSRISVLDTPLKAGICLIRVVNGSKCVSEKLIFN